MKIALIRRKFTLTPNGGAEKYACRVAEELLKRGHCLEVFAEKFQGEESENLKWRKVPKGLMAMISPTYSFHRQVQKIIRHNEFDLVYSLCRTWPADVCRITEQLHAEWLLINYGRLAEYNPRHRSILNLEKQVYQQKHTPWLITNSSLVKNQLNSRFAYPSENIKVIYNGIDRDCFFPSGDDSERLAIRKKLNLPEDNSILLFPAGNFKIKGLASAIRALGRLPDEMKEKYTLCVAGGDNPEKYQKLAGELGVAEKVIFIGARKDMRNCYIASDLLLYPSLYEPFANVCLEAFACGLPVLTTALNGSSEIVEDGASGYIVEHGSDIDNIKLCLEKFNSLSEPDRQKMSEVAIKTSTGFSWQKHVDELEKLFAQILENKK
jgi:UDP-glucose:(heptosyl)LPS alpha-1,3-glucosyltransferase